MIPKKKNNAEGWIIAIISLVAIVFVAYNFGIAWEQAQKLNDGQENWNELFEMFRIFGENIEKNPFKEGLVWNKTIAQALGWGIGGWAIACLAVYNSRKNYIHGKEHGTAQWGKISEISHLFAENIMKQEIKKAKTEKEKKKIRAKYENANALFTKTEHISIYNYELNNNVVVLGGSGSGKTRGFVMPNLLQAHSSYVITDPKGEILEKSGKFLSEVKGYKIRVLNLDDKSLSDGYNPFYYLHVEDRPGYEERVLSLIETIIVNTDGGEKKGGSDPFWEKAEVLFLQAIFFFVCDAFPAEERNMTMVMKLISMLQIEEERDKKNSDLDIFAQLLEASLNEADTEFHRAGTENKGIKTYKEFRSKASGKTAKSIVISAVARLAPFDIEAVRRIFSYDTMKLEDLGEELTAIFVVVPPTDKTYNFIAGMLFQQMFQELQYCATQVHKHDGQRLTIPVRFVMDEFANTCTVPNFPKILAYARSFGIGIIPILQSLEQIKAMYKDEWGVIIDNCNAILYLGSISHMDTLDYMSKLIGKGTFDKKTTGRTKQYRGGSHSENYDVVGRELMDTSELRKLPKKNCILVLGGYNPFYSEKYDYKKHPNYKYTSDGNKKNSFAYVPPKPPELKPCVVESVDTDKATKKKSPRREEQDPAQAAKRGEEMFRAIVERMDEELDLIQVYSDPKQALNLLSRSVPYMTPASDTLTQVNDGSGSEHTQEAIEKALSFEKEDAAVDKIIGDIEDQLITYSTDPKQGAKYIAENAAHLAPKDTEVNDGSGSEHSEDEWQLDEEEPIAPVVEDTEDLSKNIMSLLDDAKDMAIDHE